MDKYITKVLKQIESNGFEAYIVGGYVRDKLLGKKSTDVDICTNALPKDLINIFNPKVNKSHYGSLRFRTEKYTFDITTYRQEDNYVKRRPNRVVYINNLLEDLKRRDFTINAICLNNKEDIIDPLGGRKDLDNHLIRCIGDVTTKLEEDPLRILRAVRFSITLGFTLEEELRREIVNKADLVDTLSYERRREELDKILLSSNVLEGLELLKELGIFKYLEIEYQDLVYVNDICAMYSQLKISDNYNFTKSEKNIINSIRKIIKLGMIDNHSLYQYGLYINQLAGKILGIKMKKINDMFEALPIRSIKELDISYNEICAILDIKPSRDVKVLVNKMIDLILDGELENEREAIISYLRKGIK